LLKSASADNKLKVILLYKQIIEQVLYPLVILSSLVSTIKQRYSLLVLVFFSRKFNCHVLHLSINYVYVYRRFNLTLKLNAF